MEKHPSNQPDLPELEPGEDSILIDQMVEQTKPRIRASRIVLAVAVGVVVLLVVSVAVLILISRDSDGILDIVPITARDMLQSPESPVQPVPEPVVDLEPAFELPVASPVPIPESESYLQLEQKIDELKATVEKEIRVQSDAQLYLDDRIETAMSFKTVIDALVQKVDTLAAEIAQLREQPPIVHTSEHPTPPDQHARSPDFPPFELIAIDRWNAHWNAVIELEGQVTMISPTESRAGWQLVGLDPTGRTARFRNTTGIDHELSVR